MDKQDELAAGIESKLHDHGARFEYGDGLEIAAGDIAAAVRSFMGSEAQIAAASKAVAVTRFMREYSWVAREQIIDIIGACNDHEDARAALSAAIGEDIGGGRG